MLEVVKQSIEARKNAIFSSYQVTDQTIMDKIDKLFQRINEFGEKYDDVNKFETDFVNSDLNNEYINIFVEIAQKETNTGGTSSVGAMVADRIIDEVESRVMPSRAVMADARDQAIRNIPVVGDIMNAGQTVDLFHKFRKNK